MQQEKHLQMYSKEKLQLTGYHLHETTNDCCRMCHVTTIQWCLTSHVRVVNQTTSNYDVRQGSSEPALGFRRSLAHVIIWRCCSSRTFSTCTNNFTACAVKLFAFVWTTCCCLSFPLTGWAGVLMPNFLNLNKQFYHCIWCGLYVPISFSHPLKQMQTISPHAGWICLYILLLSRHSKQIQRTLQLAQWVCLYILMSPMYLVTSPLSLWRDSFITLFLVAHWALSSCTTMSILFPN